MPLVTEVNERDQITFNVTHNDSDTRCILEPDYRNTLAQNVKYYPSSTGRHLVVYVTKSDTQLFKQTQKITALPSRVNRWPTKATKKTIHWGLSVGLCIQWLFNPFSPILFLIVAKMRLSKCSAAYWSNPPFNFRHSGTLVLRSEHQSARMSEIKNGGLEWVSV